MSKFDDGCIFCKIVKGEIPCHKVYEDEHYLAFLDIAPIDRGHAILVPKSHATDLLTLETEYLDKLGGVIAHLCGELIAKLAAVGLNVTSNIGARAGQIVMHTHFHLIPRYEGSDPLNWHSGAGDHGELAALAERIRAEE